MITVEIYDTVPLFALGIAALLSSSGIRVLAVHTSLETSWSDETDIILMDSVIADPNQSTICQCNIPVIIISNNPIRRSADTCGAVKAYLERTVLPTSLLATIRSIVRGRVTRQPHSVEHEPLTSPPIQLSRREHEILTHVASGLTHAQIARSLGISRHTVDTYVKRVRSKLLVGNKAELTVAAMLLAHVPPRAHGLAVGTVHRDSNPLTDARKLDLARVPLRQEKHHT